MTHEPWRGNKIYIPAVCLYVFTPVCAFICCSASSPDPYVLEHIYIARWSPGEEFSSQEFKFFITTSMDGIVKRGLLSNCFSANQWRCWFGIQTQISSHSLFLLCMSLSVFILICSKWKTQCFWSNKSFDWASWKTNLSPESVYQLQPDDLKVHKPFRRYCKFYRGSLDFKLGSLSTLTCCQSHHWWYWKKMLMQIVFFPLLFLSGSFWNPFSNESWHSTFLQYFLQRGSGEGEGGGLATEGWQQRKCHSQGKSFALSL